jgi:hypothetical protein
VQPTSSGQQQLHSITSRASQGAARQAYLLNSTQQVGECILGDLHCTCQHRLRAHAGTDCSSPGVRHTGGGMAATAAKQQDDLFDTRFEFDAPRYYDFQAMSPGSPADKWFDTAPDGPGCKPESEALLSSSAAHRARSRTLNPLSCALLQSPTTPGSHSSSCRTMRATRHRCARR